MDWMWDFQIEIWQIQQDYKVSSPGSKAEFKPLFAADLSSISNKIMGGRGARTWRWSFQRYYLAPEGTKSSLLYQVKQVKATKMKIWGCLLLFLSLGHDLISLGTVDFTL